MFTRLTMTRFEAYSIYKILFIGFSCSMIPVGVVFGVLAAFGADTVIWNGRQLYGIQGLIASPLICVGAAIFFAGIAGTACAFGLWLYSKFRPLHLWGKNVVHHAESTN